MEFTVYDGSNRRTGRLIVVALIAGMVAAISAFFVFRQAEPTVPPGSYPSYFPLTIILVLFPLIGIAFRMRIRVDRASGESPDSLHYSATRCGGRASGSPISTASA